MTKEADPDTKSEADDSEFSYTPDTVEGSHILIDEEMPEHLSDIIEVTKDVDADATKGLEIQPQLSGGKH